MSTKQKPRGRPPKLSPAALAQFMAIIAADYENGLSIREISLKYDESDSYIYRWLSRAGVTFRPRGGSRPGQSSYFHHY
jgi:hypothetical protein